MNEETAHKYHFTLYKRHIRFLEKINPDNRSGALQTVLDSIMNGTEQTRKKRILDNSIQWISLGSILFFISYLFDPLQQLICILLGTFLFTYGIIGGVLSAIRRTNNH